MIQNLNTKIMKAIIIIAVATVFGVALTELVLHFAGKRMKEEDKIEDRAV